MTDYVREIGGDFTIMIRDLAPTGWVEFWVKPRASAWNYQQQWYYIIRGGTSSGPLTFRMEKGGNWQLAGKHYYGDLGAEYGLGMGIRDSGLGFPDYEFEVSVNLGRIPDPPGPPRFGDLTSTSVHVAFDANYDGGSPILEYQIGAAGAPYKDGWRPNTNDSFFTDLYPGGEYLFFGRVRNAFGWSHAGEQRWVRLPRWPNPPRAIKALALSQTSMAVKFDGVDWDGGYPVVEWRMGYGTDPNAAQVFISGPEHTLTDLTPGRTYYFWGQARNAAGWGGWSPRSQAALIAGARVRTATGWKRAVPYVRVGGTWEMVRPWIKVRGTWRRTS